MAKKMMKNDRCPLQDECGRKTCEFKLKEATCDYYAANSRPGFEIEGQEIKYDDAFDVLADDEEENSLKYISIDELYPHPDNPRKDLGDLTELVDSIKENGVLQNLLVVHGHNQTREEWKALTAKYRENPSEELRTKMNQRNVDEGYTVIIGHRRLAAAKEAGLTELPCVITEMDKATQIAVMMLENGQRKDLSVYEQAQGMQMLFNLGESIHDISKKTGFSETTVRHRVKLLDLDAQKFKESAERGATIADYVKLEQLEDPKLKNEVLEYIGTNDFNWKLNAALNTEKERKKKERWFEILNSFATRVKKKSNYTQVGYAHWFGNDPDSTQFITPKDANEVAYYYYVENNNYFYLLKDKDENEQSDPAAEKKANEEEARVQRLNELKTANEAARNMRKVFVMNYVGKKEHLTELVKFLSYNLISDYYEDCDEENLAELLCIEWGEDEEERLCDKPEYIELCEKHPYKILLTMMFERFDYDETCHDSWYGKYTKNSGLEKWYDLLEKLGYPISTDERQLLDGTHELYLKADTK